MNKIELKNMLYILNNKSYAESKSHLLFYLPIMVDALSVSRIHTTHKTYKKKLYSSSNITGLWEKISESFNVEDDRYSIASTEVIIDKEREKTEKPIAHWHV